MAQLHGIHRGVAALRPTLDVDMVLHIETSPGVVAEAVGALESLTRALPDDAREWRTLPEPWRTNGQTALRILTA